MIPNATLLYSKTVSAINIPLHMYRFLNALSTTLYVRNLKDTPHWTNYFKYYKESVSINAYGLFLLPERGSNLQQLG